MDQAGFLKICLSLQMFNLIFPFLSFIYKVACSTAGRINPEAELAGPKGEQQQESCRW